MAVQPELEDRCCRAPAWARRSSTLVPELDDDEDGSGRRRRGRRRSGDGEDDVPEPVLRAARPGPAGRARSAWCRRTRRSTTSGVDGRRQPGPGTGPSALVSPRPPLGIRHFVKHFACSARAAQVTCASHAQLAPAPAASRFAFSSPKTWSAMRPSARRKKVVGMAVDPEAGGDRRPAGRRPPGRSRRTPRAGRWPACASPSRRPRRTPPRRPAASLGCDQQRQLLATRVAPGREEVQHDRRPLQRGEVDPRPALPHVRRRRTSAPSPAARPTVLVRTPLATRAASRREGGEPPHSTTKSPVMFGWKSQTKT